MEIDELKKRVAEEQKRVEASKKKRDTIATLAFIGIYLLIFYFLSEQSEDFNDYFSILFSAILTGALHHGINSAVYESLLSKNKADRWYLEKLQEELHEKEHDLFEKSLAETMKNIHERW